MKKPLSFMDYMYEQIRAESDDNSNPPEITSNTHYVDEIKYYTHYLIDYDMQYDDKKDNKYYANMLEAYKSITKVIF